jgi:hypothetical protein
MSRASVNQRNLLNGCVYRGFYTNIKVRVQRSSQLLQTYPPSVENFTKAHFLFLAAGNTAECIKYGIAEDATAKSDWSFFDNPGAPPLEETREEAHSMLLSKNRQLKRLVSLLKAKCSAVDYDITKLPEADPLKNGETCNVLLSKEETEEAIRRK